MIKIFCDHCERDLTLSKGGYDHCLYLQDKKYGRNRSNVIDYYMEPLLEEEAFFCGFECLKRWLSNKK